MRRIPSANPPPHPPITGQKKGGYVEGARHLAGSFHICVFRFQPRWL